MEETSLNIIFINWYNLLGEETAIHLISKTAINHGTCDTVLKSHFGLKFQTAS